MRELLLEGCHEVLRRAGFGEQAQVTNDEDIAETQYSHAADAATVNTMEYALLAVSGTLPASATELVSAAGDALCGNHAHLKVQAPNRLGGVASRRTLKMYVIR